MSERLKDYTLGGMEANIKSLGVIIPLAVMMIFMYQYSWGWTKAATDFMFYVNDYLLFALSLILGTVAHELLHAVTWAFTAGLGWDRMRFGFSWKAVAPYAHCSEPMTAEAYRIGIIAPGLILGMLPFLAGLITGQGFVAGFGFLFTIVAGGDFLMLWLIRDVGKNQYVRDHPEKIGCIVTDNKNSLSDE